MKNALRYLEVWMTVARSWVGLRVMPEREVAFALAPPESSEAAPDPALVRIFVNGTRWIARGRCLLLAVALTRLLRRRGVPATFHVGFAPGYERFSGHAWVECAGVPLGQAATIREGFVPFNVTAAGLAAFLFRRARECGGRCEF